MPQSKNTLIPLKKLSQFTERKFLLRYDGDGAQREPVLHSHRDDYYMFGVVIAGEYRMAVDFDEVTLGAGSALIITPGQVHSSVTRSGKGFVLIVAPELLSDADVAVIRRHSLTQKAIKLPQDDFNDIVCLSEILKRRPDRCGAPETSLAYAIKNMVIANITGGPNSAGNRYVRLVVALQDCIEKNFASIKQPHNYAGLLNVSGVYLNEAVKAVTGRNVSTFIGEYLITLAKRSLYHTNLTATEIAANMGFDDYSYFSRLFKRHTGMSPKAFRSKYLD